jgi:hypothetical protein
MRNWAGLVGLVGLVLCGIAGGQEAKPESTKQPVVSQTARLQAAKTVFVRHSGGSEIPYNVIETGLQGWARLMVVEDPAKADLIAEISSPSDGSGVSVSSTTMPSSTHPGRDDAKTTTSRDLSNSPVKLVVYDAKSKVALWSAMEQPKMGLKQKAREDKLVEAAQRLLAKFRERVEPERQ